MNKRERLQAALKGQPVDRPPVALWRHFPVDDQTPEDLAAAQLEFQATYDFDFVKVTPASSFCLKDWGAQDVWRGNPEGTREYTGRVIHKNTDWYSLKVLDPSQGFLAAQLKALDLIRQGLPTETPVIQTVFGPMSQLKNLVGGDQLPVHLRLYPDEVLAALKVITETTLRFVDAAKRTGIDGIFYAVQLATYQNMTEAEYATFGEAFDRQILDAVSDLWLNVLHLHGEAVMFDKVSGYPAQVINWHDRETPPTLAEGQDRFNGAVCGGWRQWDTMVLGTPDQVRAEAKDAIAQTHGQRLILGTGCVTPITAPRANLRAARQSVEG